MTLWTLPFVLLSTTAASPNLGDLRQVGTSTVKTACSPAAQTELDHGLALLHSFFYREARRVFLEAAAKDEKCAMAHWGVAMTWWHPIWTPPTPEEMEAGRAAIERAKAAGARSDVEKGLIAAADAFYNAPADKKPDAGGQSCHGPTGGDHRGRALAFEKAMADLHARHPEDVEIATFYALALLGTTPPGDKTLANPGRATEILERFGSAHGSHPGRVHYLIHGYDYPPVAEKGLAAARSYATIAPWVPHALHMPSHIFTRLGLWNDVIDSNRASADAARQYAARHHPDATSFEELHALDYMVYGYLQTGQDDVAKEAVRHLLAIRKTQPEIDFAATHAMGAIPARYTLERRQWAEAAALTVPEAPHWKAFPFAEGHLVFARALGAARSGRLAEARTGIQRLEQVAAGMADPRFAYFGKQAGMQVKVIQGWLAFADGDRAAAEKLLRETADLDDALGKHPVSPGSILPAREMLADFLFETGRHADALAEYEACLKLNPRRLNSLFGAGQAAERSERADVARRYYGEIDAMAVRDAQRPEVKKARAYLVNGRRAGR